MIDVRRAPALVGQQLVSLRVLTSAGVIRPYPPQVLARLARTLVTWGTGPAGGFTTMAQRAPHQVALVDELGELTFRELHERSNALADSFKSLGVAAGDGIAIMCRNHRGFVDASIAAAKVGADLLYLNTAFAGPQLVEVLEREKPALVVHDEEFSGLLDAAEDIRPVLGWTDGERSDADTLDQLIAAGSREDHHPPPRPSRVIILTSGTTGTPKGAPRSEAGVDAAVALLSRLPLRRGWRTHIAAPLFHTWGWAHWALAMLLGSTMVLRRRFEPEDCLRAVTEHGCDSLVVIPVMLQRILQLPQEVLDSYDLSKVKVVAASGSALPGDLGVSWMDQFGDTLYNIYGSTEVAYATVAQPRDLRAAPGTAGRAPYATVVKILDEEGDEVPPGEPGRIFVGNTLLFEGYTGGGSKDVVDGLMATGDVGRFDAEGRLFVEGRDDDMIVSGGENVFPQEVEDCLARHDEVVEVACIGVDDQDFGKRLRAFVVRREGGSVDEEALKGHVKAHLARYKVPREVVFVDELPRNATGKILKRELAEAGPDA
ncbi:AMP-binding protein [Nocardioides mesophilus]|uniref:AMP-binding protein n=1 Tax=Nocardioides mesophilus TaxID=433659 RepID=A0A7G9RCE7_9ACTN|nr:AMP-binding protein [Nocardioides mesophilus]QNN53272.1 AMP-binding protein [Nocardioides mesophilus]